jgi:hypothetical protein
VPATATARYDRRREEGEKEIRYDRRRGEGEKENVVSPSPLLLSSLFGGCRFEVIDLQ